jgi:hypothetical protein
MTTSWQAAHDLALSLPDAEERDHFGSPSFRVGGKIFAQLSAPDHQPARALVKLSSADQAALTMTDTQTFSSEPSWGRHGWTYVALASVDASMLHDLLWQSWRLVATKKSCHGLRSPLQIIPTPNQRPTKVALRFSRNAEVPSRMSSVENASAKPWVSKARP